MKKPSEDNILSHEDVSPEVDTGENEVQENEIGSESVAAPESKDEDKPVPEDMAAEIDDFKFLKHVSVKRSSHSSHSHSSHSSGSGHHHHHHHKRKRRRRKKMKTWKKVLIIVISVLLAIVLAVTGVLFYLVNKGHEELFDVQLNVQLPDTIQAEVQDDGDYIFYNGRTYSYNHDVTSILFLGIDKRSIEDDTEQGTGGQADFAVLVAVNVKSHKMTMFPIPRDTITEVAKYSPSGTYNGMAKMQLCLAYAYGDGKESSCENMVSSVRRIFYNVPVKTYYALDLDGIAAMNDAVGGIDVVSPETISDFTKGESYHLEGKQAESFVRSRVHNDKNASSMRLERQKVYVKGFLSKMQKTLKNNIFSSVTLFNESSPYSITNLNAAKVSYLAKEFMFGGGMETIISDIKGEVTLDANNKAEFKIDEQQFFEQFLSVYYE